MKINLYDFDNTIYAGDSSYDFLFYCFLKRPYLIIIFPRYVIVSFLYLLKIIPKTLFKENIFRVLKYIPNQEIFVKEFWLTHKKNIKKFYMEKSHENDVIISASPEFLLIPICNDLKVKKLIASRVDIKSGKFYGLNCHDIEKVKRLNQEFSDYIVMEAYSDSLTDLPILKLAQKSYLVKKDKITPTDFKNY